MPSPYRDGAGEATSITERPRILREGAGSGHNRPSYDAPRAGPNDTRDPGAIQGRPPTPIPPASLPLPGERDLTTIASSTGYAAVNGLNMYYEIHGAGEPLILLHGGLGATGMFGAIMPALSGSRQVIAVDFQGHGRTADIDRPLSYEHMADDIAGLMETLHIRQADIMGYSMGGGVACQTAIRHPDMVRGLVIVSIPFKQTGWYPDVRAAMSGMGPRSAEMMKPSPIYQMYSAIAPKVEDWPKLHTKLRDLITADYDWSASVAAIKARTLLAFGDADAMPSSHMAAFYELLGGSQKDPGWDGSGMSRARLAILPGLTHYNMFSSPMLASVVGAFLDGAMAGPK
jgi:pimeloyl-ACP methyl ester carboxylesterase